MNETCMYRGHAIDLDVHDATNERIQWTYFIDKRYCMQGAMDAQPFDTARINALALARNSIDKLDSMQSGNAGTPALPPVSCRVTISRINRGA